MHELDEKIKFLMKVSTVSYNTKQGKLRICKVCGKEGIMSNIINHIEVKHITTFSHACNVCGKVFRYRDISLKKIFSNEYGQFQTKGKSAPACKALQTFYCRSSTSIARGQHHSSQCRFQDIHKSLLHEILILVFRGTAAGSRCIHSIESNANTQSFIIGSSKANNILHQYLIEIFILHYKCLFNSGRMT